MPAWFDNIMYIGTQVIQVIIFSIGCYFLGISMFGWIKRKEHSPFNYPPRKTFALIVAAHNEETVIAHIVDSLSKQNYPRNMYDIFVIADNCSDNTAAIARHHGAIVYERFDEGRKGKGHALEWMFQKLFLMGNKYDVVSIFDADNLVSANYLLEMNKELSKGHIAVQGYIDSKNPFDSWITSSYSIAFWMSNRIFQLPRHYLGLTCGLCGTGFCIDMKILKKIGWGATCLTEDLEFTLKLAINNMKVSWAHNAVVYDEKPLTLKQSWHQRKRWMQGHADCASRYIKALLKKAFKEGDLSSFDCVLYLFQPIRFIFAGLITIMMWFQTIYPKSPFYNISYAFPVQIWWIFAALQFLYGPLVILAEKKFKLKVLLGFLIYPFYCITWVPITIQGFIHRNKKDWSHTEHTREISISELEEA